MLVTIFGLVFGTCLGIRNGIGVRGRVNLPPASPSPHGRFFSRSYFEAMDPTATVKRDILLEALFL